MSSHVFDSSKPFDMLAHHMRLALKERNCTARLGGKTITEESMSGGGVGVPKCSMKGLLLELLTIPIYMNDGRTYQVRVNTEWPVCRFLAHDAMEDMLVGDIKKNAIETLDKMIFDKMISEKACLALAAPIKELHVKNLYLDFEKTRVSWSNGGPVMQVDQALLQLAKLIPTDIYNDRFLDRIELDLYLCYFEFNSLLRGQRFCREELLMDIVRLGDLD